MAIKRQKNTTKKRIYTINKICRFCYDRKKNIIDYKNVRTLQGLITERGKIMPRRISGNCATHQRQLTIAVKRSRSIALLPFTVGQ